MSELPQVHPATHLRGLLADIGVNPKEIRMSGDSETSGEYAQLTRQNLKKHNDLITQHAQHLADRGVQIAVREHRCGHKSTVMIGQNSYGNQGGHYGEYKVGVDCDRCGGGH